MEYAGKTALVVGLARSGIAAAKILDALGVHVIVNDMKNDDHIMELVNELKQSTNAIFCPGLVQEALLQKVDFIVISPGVPIDSPFILQANTKGKEVIGEVELAYRFCKAPIVAITGTNGKTTTTALVGEIFKAAERVAHVVGNIGIPFISKVMDIVGEDIVVAEISSFQLESVKQFRPKVSVILNITEDHLNRHITMENYINSKARIFQNADSNDWLILNADDDCVSAFATQTTAEVLYFSSMKRLSKGAWIEEHELVLDLGSGIERVCAIEDIAMPGRHNLSNALAAALMTRVLGVPSNIIGEVLAVFPGVEHRIEKVAVIDGVAFYNDSKGTNPDASIKAVEAMTGPTVLIAGGMDKNNDFTQLVDAFGTTITALVVLGETADLISRTARNKGFNNIYKTVTMQEAVKKSFELSVAGGNVLLSPACASWDMFKDYEERGRIFKDTVRELRR